jgi:hypothetical protein
MARGDAVVGEGDALARPERVAGELARRCTAGECGGGATLGRGGDSARGGFCAGERHCGRWRARVGRRRRRERTYVREENRGGGEEGDVRARAPRPGEKV